MEETKQAPITIGAQEGQSISVVGDTYRILVTGKQTGGAFATIDMLIPPNGGPGPHAHADFQESFFVVEGEVEVKSEAGSYIATAGSYVVIPKGGIVHDFKNHTDKTAHLLCMVAPSGLEKFFLEIGKPVAFGTFVAPVTDPESMKKVQAAGEKYGQHMFPPDYLNKK